MRLVVLHPWGGAPTRQDFYARLITQTGWEVTLMVPTRWRDEYGKTVTPTRLPSFTGSLMAFPLVLPGNIVLHAYAGRLASALRRQRPDAIYVYQEAYGVSAYQMALANARSVAAPLAFHTSQNILKAYPFPFSRMESYVYSQAAVATAVSKTAGEVLNKKGFTKRVITLPWGVDTTRFSLNPGRDLREPPERLKIGFAGRLVAEKGIDTLLRAIRRLPRECCQLIVVGHGAQRAELMRTALELGISGDVDWQDPLAHDQMADFYHNVHIVAVPSRTTPRWKEQFGRVVLEAASSGRPVIASDSGELPRVVEATRSGWIFPEGDDEALAALLLRILSDRSVLASVGARARETVLASYSEDAIVARFADAMRELASQAATRT